MRIILTVFLFFLPLILAVSCGKKKHHDPPPAPAVVIHDPSPGPQPVPEPPAPDPGPDPDPEPIPEPEPEPIPEPEPEPIPVPIDLSKTFKVNVTYHGDMVTDARIAKLEKAAEILKSVVALDAFREKILNFDSPYSVNMFFDTLKTNAEIYQHILNGNERLQPEQDNELDVEVEWYYAATNTVGYTYGTSKRIWMNIKYFDNYAVSSAAATLMHEWLHKLSYSHAVQYSDSRNYSVPYAVGSMVRVLGKQFE